MLHVHQKSESLTVHNTLYCLFIKCCYDKKVLWSIFFTVAWTKCTNSNMGKVWTRFLNVDLTSNKNPKNLSTVAQFTNWRGWGVVRSANGIAEEFITTVKGWFSETLLDVLFRMFQFIFSRNRWRSYLIPWESKHNILFQGFIS